MSNPASPDLSPSAEHELNHMGMLIALGIKAIGLCRIEVSFKTDDAKDLYVTCKYSVTMNSIMISITEKCNVDDMKETRRALWDVARKHRDDSLYEKYLFEHPSIV